ncbi:hypothetical protein RP20_CCG017412 [Aedes albopictus]|nr:hypothetical protein RP20_CCG017412 [Aedes albopictus]
MRSWKYLEIDEEQCLPIPSASTDRPPSEEMLIIHLRASEPDQTGIPLLHHPVPPQPFPSTEQ